MPLHIPSTNLELAASTAIITHSDEWGFLITQLADLVHPADFWQESEDKLLSIDKVRELHYFALKTPTQDVKIAVLKSGNLFQKETVNALLKIVEEPPPHFYIVILSETDYFLPTLSSRLRRLQFKGDSDTMDSKWQIGLKKAKLDTSLGRERAKRLLYLHALTHATIKPEPIIDSFS